MQENFKRKFEKKGGSIQGNTSSPPKARIKRWGDEYKNMCLKTTKQ